MGDLSNWLYNIATQIPALIKLIVAFAYIGGFWCLMIALGKFKKCSQGAMTMQQYSVGEPLIYLFVGAVLLYFAGFVKVGAETLFGETSALAYQTNLIGGGAFSNFINPIILIIRLVGYMAFLKGVFMLTKVGGGHGQPGTLGKAGTHIFGGILAINIEATYLVLLNTLQGTNYTSF